MPRDNRCMYMAHVCFMTHVVTVFGSVGMFVVYRSMLKIVFSLGVLKYVVCVRDMMDIVFSVCIETRRAVGARVYTICTVVCNRRASSTTCMLCRLQPRLECCDCRLPSV